ncbi:MAG: D-alanyl-D-alanine carboxypeptidase/D-alanyl-D-alanine endopeptidase [Armatimonadota bacterium]
MGSNRNSFVIRCAGRLLLALWLTFTVLSGVQGEQLARKIDQFLSDPVLNHGVQSVMVRSLKTGTTIYERNADLAMIPASNMKLIVSATALDRLGPDFTYSTRVYTCGKVNARGVVEGDLALVGGGDPTLETRDLRNLAREIKCRGIRKVAGDVIVDDYLFDDRRLGTGWAWDDLSYYYSAEISALNLNRNTVRVWVYPGKCPGEPAVVRLDPANSYMEIESIPITGEANSQKAVWVSRVLGANVVKMGGSIPVGVRVSGPEAMVTVHEPAIYAGHVFVSELRKQGIVVLGKVRREKVNSDAVLVCEHRSPPLSEILKLLNKPSDNLIAEVLLKTLGAVIKGNGSAESGREVEKEFLSAVGVDMSGVSIVDGSGLSRLNCLTARSLVDLLSFMYRHKHFKVFLDSLPIAGVDGTLRNRMRGTRAQNNVRAKTGYVSRVSSVSGYLTTRSGEPLVFAILMNRHLCTSSSATAIQDKICEQLAELE